MAFVRKDDTNMTCVGGTVIAAPIYSNGEPSGSLAWETLGGFTGTAVMDGSNANIFGDLVTGGFNVSGLTAPPGTCSALLTLPLPPAGGVFTKASQGTGSVAGANTASGALAAGTVVAVAGSPKLLVTVTNTTGSPVTPTVGFQGAYQYKLTATHL